MNFLVRLFGGQPATAQIAKQRLHLVLAHDRVSLSPEKMELLKDEILSAISRHIAIDREHVAFTISRGPDGNRLMADIPVLRPPNPLADGLGKRPTPVRRPSRRSG